MNTIKLEVTLKEAAALHVLLDVVSRALTIEHRPNAGVEDRLKLVLQQKLEAAGCVLDESGWAKRT